MRAPPVSPLPTLSAAAAASSRPAVGSWNDVSNSRRRGFFVINPRCIATEHAGIGGEEEDEEEEEEEGAARGRKREEAGRRQNEEQIAEESRAGRGSRGRE